MQYKQQYRQDVHVELMFLLQWLQSLHCSQQGRVRLQYSSVYTSRL